MALNIERRQRYSGQGRTYVKSQAKVPIKFDLQSLDLMCSFVLSENRNVKRIQYINLRNLIAMLDLEMYINDQEAYKRIMFIRKGLEARLIKDLTNPVTIIKYINGGIMDDDIIDINTFVSLSNAEIEWLNETISNALNYSFIWMDADRAIELFTKFKAADYRSVSGIVDEIEAFVANLNTKFRKAKVAKATDQVFSLRDESFRNIVSEICTELNNQYRKLQTGMQGLNKLIGGGFENTRAYLFIGMTGVGKSMTLLDIAYQIKKYNKGYMPKDPTKTPCVVILSMENSVTETFQRLFQMAVGGNVNLQNYTPDEIMYMLKTTGELFLTDDSPIDIIIKFKPNRSEDTSYLYTLTEDLEDEGYEVICMIQDHVKRMKATTGQTDVRLELGDVVNEMKTFAMIKDIPLITVSHVNRDGVRVIDSSSTGNKVDLTRMLGAAFIGESMLMLDNIDFGCILNVEYDEEGHKYAVFKGVKFRIQHEEDYICQPYEYDNDMKLQEDLYSDPVYRTTLSPVPVYQNNPQQLSHSKIKLNGYSSAIQNEPEKKEAKANDIFEAIENHSKITKGLNIPVSNKPADLYMPMQITENRIMSLVS